MKALSVQAPSQSHQSRPWLSSTNQPIPAQVPDIAKMNMVLDLDLQERSLHHSTTSNFSDKLYNKLIAQVTGVGGTVNDVPMNEDLYNPTTLTKCMPGFRQFPLVRFILAEVI